VKTKNEKEHNTFVHIDDNTFACKRQRFIGLLFLPQGSKQAKINHAILMYFNII